MHFKLPFRRAILTRKSLDPIAGLLISGHGSAKTVLLIGGVGNYYLRVSGA